MSKIDERALAAAVQRYIESPMLPATELLRNAIEAYESARQPEASQQPVSSYEEKSGDLAGGFDSPLSTHQPDQEAWEDKPDQWQDAIDNAHPTITGKHKTYAKALEMVSNRHGKGDLVDLVNWLLAYRRPSEVAGLEREAAQPDEATVVTDKKLEILFRNVLSNHWDAAKTKSGNIGSIRKHLIAAIRPYLRSPKRESVGYVQADLPPENKGEWVFAPLTEEEQTEAIKAMISAAQSRGYDGRGMSSALTALLERFYVGRRA